MTLTMELCETFAMIEQAAAGSADPWWIIGSAAVVLHGGAVRRVRDVDLMMSARDADMLLRRVRGQVCKPDADNRFRSLVFGIWNDPPIPVEVFGGFKVATAGEWRELSLTTRQSVTVGGSRVYLPSREEMIAILHAFGRPKDLDRAGLLRS